MLPSVDSTAATVSIQPPGAPIMRRAAEASGVALVASSGSVPCATIWISM